MNDDEKDNGFGQKNPTNPLMNNDYSDLVTKKEIWTVKEGNTEEVLGRGKTTQRIDLLINLKSLGMIIVISITKF